MGKVTLINQTEEDIEIREFRGGDDFFNPIHMKACATMKVDVRKYHESFLHTGKVSVLKIFYRGSYAEMEPLSAEDFIDSNTITIIKEQIPQDPNSTGADRLVAIMEPRGSGQMELDSSDSESDGSIEGNNSTITWRETLLPNPQRGQCICFRTVDLYTDTSVLTRFYSVPFHLFGDGGDDDVSSSNPDVEGLEPFYKCTDFATTSTLSSVGSSLFVVGGSREIGPCRVSVTTDKMYRFDTIAPENSWYSYELSMCTPRAFPMTVAMDGKLYIFGGSGPESPDAPLAEMFNPESSTFESLPRPPSFHINGWRHLVVAALQPYKKILVASGLSDVVSVYNVVKGVWEELDHKVDFSSVRGQAAVVQNGNALCWCSNNVEEVHAYHLVHKRWFKSPIKGLDKVGMRDLDEPMHDCLIFPLDDNHLCLLWKDHMGYDGTNLPLLHCIKIQVSIDLRGSRFDAAVVASRTYALGPDESIFDAHVL